MRSWLLATLLIGFLALSSGQAYARPHHGRHHGRSYTTCRKLCPTKCHKPRFLASHHCWKARCEEHRRLTGGSLVVGGPGGYLSIRIGRVSPRPTCGNGRYYFERDYGHRGPFYHQGLGRMRGCK